MTKFRGIPNHFSTPRNTLCVTCLGAVIIMLMALRPPGDGYDYLPMRVSALPEW